MGFIDRIVEWFDIIGKILKNFVVAIGQLLRIIPEIMNFHLSAITYIPAFLVSFFVLGLTLKIVLLIVGRQHD